MLGLKSATEAANAARAARAAGGAGGGGKGGKFAALAGLAGRAAAAATIVEKFDVSPFVEKFRQHTEGMSPARAADGSILAPTSVPARKADARRSIAVAPANVSVTVNVPSGDPDEIVDAVGGEVGAWWSKVLSDAEDAE
jgi:hypothetical protein